MSFIEARYIVIEAKEVIGPTFNTKLVSKGIIFFALLTIVFKGSQSKTPDFSLLINLKSELL